MQRLLQLLGLGDIVADTHKGELPPTELRHPAYKIARLYEIIDGDKNSNLRLITNLFDYFKKGN